MGIVNDLQSSVDADDVATVLRKASRVAAKLGLNDINDWLNNEQDGYAAENDVPAYRKVHQTLWYSTNGPIPIGGGLTMNGMQQITNLGLDQILFPVVNPIATIEVWISQLTGGQHVAQPIDGELERTLKRTFGAATTRPDIVERFTFHTRLNEYEIRQIPEAVKNRVLKWALELEQAGIQGDGMSFTEKEVEAARGLTLNLKVDNSVNKFTATNVQGAIQNASPHGSQTVSVSVNPDLTAALDRLGSLFRDSRVDPVDQAELVSNVELLRTLAKNTDTSSGKLKEKMLRCLGVIADTIAVYGFLQADALPLMDTVRTLLGV